jgi:UDP-N-acetylmuramoyl-tripeptide--D-alanyl-D-alanine ligase
MNGILHGSDAVFAGVSTDTRSLLPGQLFFALQGPNFDGATFVETAKEKGAAAAVVARQCDTDLPQIVVEDTRQALGQLAQAWRDSLDTRVVAVTGSNGKTTLKAMTAACLSELGRTLSTRGNLNNDIGLPLMMFELDRRHAFAVLELGANHHGEIAYLTRLLNPNVAIISNAGPAHLEGFGSIEGVARAKGEILHNSARLTDAVLNAEDRYFDYWSGLAASVRVTSFGLGDYADVYATEIDVTVTGSRFRLHAGDDSVPVKLAFAGPHNVLNACGAAAVAMQVGASLEQVARGLEKARPVAGRLRPLAGMRGCTIFDDSYNANPTSTIAAARFLGGLEGDAWLVLGDMGELGIETEALHREVGAEALSAGVDRLLATGEAMKSAVAAFGDRGEWFENVDDLVAELRESVDSRVNLLIKGSRFMRMERVVEALSCTPRHENSGEN